jgi:Cytochrome P450
VSLKVTTVISVKLIPDRCCMAVCRDLFMAGTDTTFNSITYALVYMVKYPHVQRKVQEELDSVVGGDRLPGLEDRPR